MESSSIITDDRTMEARFFESQFSGKTPRKSCNETIFGQVQKTIPPDMSAKTGKRSLFYANRSCK